MQDLLNDIFAVITYIHLYVEAIKHEQVNQYDCPVEGQNYMILQKNIAFYKKHNYNIN